MRLEGLADLVRHFPANAEIAIAADELSLGGKIPYQGREPFQRQRHFAFGRGLGQLVMVPSKLVAVMDRPSPSAASRTAPSEGMRGFGSWTGSAAKPSAVASEPQGLDEARHHRFSTDTTWQAATDDPNVAVIM